MTDITVAAIPPAYTIRRLYLKGASVEVPHMDRMPRGPSQPAVSIDVLTEGREGWPGTVECLLRLTVEARVGDLVAYVVEVTEAGVFEFSTPMAQDELAQFVRRTAPAILFPMARRDLAALAVAGGFQPVVLDHVDFGGIEMKVVPRAEAQLQPAPIAVSVGIDAVAAAQVPRVQAPPVARSAAATSPAPAPAATAAPAAAAPDASREGPDTEPSPDTQPNWLDTQPVSPEKSSAPDRRSGAAVAACVVVIAVAAAAAWWWLRDGTPQRELRQGQPQASPVAPASATQASPLPAASMATPTADLPAGTRKALDDSREQLAALPPGWRSIELGHMDVTADLRALESLPLQAPLYVVRLPEGQLQVLYGAFPSQDAAAAALEDTRGWKAQGLRGEPRIVALGRAS